jgi:hypothetical protein
MRSPVCQGWLKLCHVDIQLAMDIQLATDIAIVFVEFGFCGDQTLWPCLEAPWTGLCLKIGGNKVTCIV